MQGIQSAVKGNSIKLSRRPKCMIFESAGEQNTDFMSEMKTMYFNEQR